MIYTETEIQKKKRRKMWHLTSTLQRPNKGEKERKARMMAAAAARVAAGGGGGVDSSSATTSASASASGGVAVGRAKTFRHNRNRSAGPITAPGDTGSLTRALFSSALWFQIFQMHKNLTLLSKKCSKIRARELQTMNLIRGESKIIAKTIFTKISRFQNFFMSYQY